MVRETRPAPEKSIVICLTFDVEWAHPEVLEDVLKLLNDRGLKGTFFCTHEGIEVPGHERGLHPNFRVHGETVKKIRAELGPDFDKLGESELYRLVGKRTHEFAPEALGVRAHSLHYDSLLPRLYHQSGLQYDASYFMPLTANLAPLWKEFDVLEIPTYFIDHFELKTGRTGFKVENLRLEEPGIKVLDFHPNMIFINAATDAQFQGCKDFYHDPKRLLQNRSTGRGIRTLFIDLIDLLAKRSLSTITMGEVSAEQRRSRGAQSKQV